MATLRALGIRAPRQNPDALRVGLLRDIFIALKAFLVSYRNCVTYHSQIISWRFGKGMLIVVIATPLVTHETNIAPEEGHPPVPETDSAIWTKHKPRRKRASFLLMSFEYL